MATNEQGIMALPEGQQSAMPQLSYMDSYDAVRQGFKQARPDVDMEVQEVMAQMRTGLDKLDDVQLQALIDIVTFLYENPDQYAKEIAQAVQDGDLDAGVFPEEYDEEFLSVLLAALLDEQRSRDTGSGMMMPPPQNFARGGIAEAARLVASQGRRGDTMLAHITPAEMRLLKSRGGSGTINPVTGLPEFFLKKLWNAATGVVKGAVNVVKNVVKGVVNVAKEIVKSPVGRIVATIGLATVLGPAAGAFGIKGLGLVSAPIASGIASGAVTALSGGDLKQILTSSVVGFISAPGGPVSNFVGKYTGPVINKFGINNPEIANVVNAATNATVVGTGAGLIQGQSLKEAVQGGLTQGAIAGGIAYVQGVPPQQANADAARAATDATEDVIGKQIAKSTGGAIDPEDIVVDSVRRTDLGNGQISKVMTLKDGTVVEQVVDMYDAPLSAPTPIGASAYSPAGRGAPALSGQGQPLTVDQEKLAAISKGAPAVGPSAMLDEMAARPAPIVDKSITLPPIVEASPSMAEVAAPYKYPEVTDALGKTGSGIANIAKGNFAQGYEQVKGGLGDLFFPGGPTPEQMDLAEASLIESRKAAGLPLSGRAYDKALDAALKEPGVLRTYGPATAAGIAALGMAGGFEPKPPPPSEFAKEMRQPIDLSDNPSAYYVQGLPGVQYNERGEIIGSSAWSPSETMQDVQVTTPSYINYMPASYSLSDVQAATPSYVNYQAPAPAPMMAAAQSPYSQYIQPTFLNQGGIAALARGGYPRRIGQISGPGTETSDDIPAMLSDGEFVMTARAVRGMGNGSRREGAKKMYALMHQLERNAARG